MEIIISLLVIVGLLTSTGVLIAYEKIPVKNQSFKQRVQSIVFKLPFLPKTPKYIMFASLAAHENVTSGYLDASFAITGTPLPEPLNAFPLEMSMKGTYDYSDLENPISDININFANQLELDARTLDGKSYFKLNKLPTILLAFLGIANPESFDVLLDTWVWVDTAQLNTDARKSLIEQSNTKRLDELNEKYLVILGEMLDENILPLVTMTNETLDGVKTYRLHMELDSEKFTTLLKAIIEKSSDPLSEDFGFDERGFDSNDIEPIDELEIVKFTAWVDAKTFYIKKMEGYMKFNFDNNSGIGINGASTVPLFTNLGEKQTMEMVGTINFSRYSEIFDVVAPANAIPFEDYIVRASELFGGGLFGIPGSADTSFLKAKSDVELLTVSTDLFFATEKVYPTSLTQLSSSKFNNADLFGAAVASKIKYSVASGGKAVIIYSTIKDPSNLLQPYYVTVISAARTNQNYNAIELNNLLIANGIPEDQDLKEQVLITPQLPPEIQPLPI